MNFSSLKKCMLLSLAVIAIGNCGTCYCSSDKRDNNQIMMNVENRENTSIVNIGNAKNLVGYLEDAISSVLQQLFENNSERCNSVALRINEVFFNGHDSNIMDLLCANKDYDTFVKNIINLPSNFDSDSMTDYNDNATELSLTNKILNCAKLIRVLNGISASMINDPVEQNASYLLNTFCNICSNLEEDDIQNLIKQIISSYNVNYRNIGFSIFLDFVEKLVNNSSYYLKNNEVASLNELVVNASNNFSLTPNGRIISSFAMQRKADLMASKHYRDQFNSESYFELKNRIKLVSQAVNAKFPMMSSDFMSLLGHVIFQPQNAELVQKIINHNITHHSPITSVGDLSMFLLDVVNSNNTASNNLTNVQPDQGKHVELTGDQTNQINPVKVTEEQTDQTKPVELTAEQTDQTKPVELTAEQKKERIKRFQDCAINVICNQYGYEVVNMVPENEYFMGSVNMTSNTIDIQKDKIPVASRIRAAISSNKDSFTVRLPRDNQDLKERILKEGFMGCFPANELNNNTKSIRVFFAKKEK